MLQPAGEVRRGVARGQSRRGNLGHVMIPLGHVMILPARAMFTCPFAPGPATS